MTVYTRYMNCHNMTIHTRYMDCHTNICRQEICRHLSSVAVCCSVVSVLQCVAVYCSFSQETYNFKGGKD